MANNEGVLVQSVARAVDIIDCFDEWKNELSLSQIAQRLNLSRSTIYGLVNTLTTCGMLEQNPDTKRYRLGVKLFKLGNQVHKRMNLRHDARPFCEALARECNATVHLAALYGDELLYVDKVDAPEGVVIYSKIGRRVPMYCTGVGKAVLAFLPSERRQRCLVGEVFQQYTANTVTGLAELNRELEQVRKNRYAFDNEEIEPNLRCVAVPIFNHEHIPVAAISASFPAGGLPLENVPGIAAQVLDYACKIARRLGNSRTEWYETVNPGLTA